MRRKRLVTAGLLSAALVAALGGCGLVDKSAEGSAPTGDLEKSTIKVADLKIVDSAPLRIAMDNGYFKAEGLTVDLTTGGKGSVNIDNVIGGSIDIGLASYPPAILAQAKKAADLKIVFDAVSTTENLFLLVVKKNGDIKDIGQLNGKKIAVSSSGGIGELAVRAQLKVRNVNVPKEAYVSMPFGDMPAALERGDVDAAIMNEPFLTQALQGSGVTKLLSPFTGATASFPTSGYIANKKFTDANPKTVAAFQRAMLKAVSDTPQRDKVEGVVIKYVGVPGNIASLMALPDFPSTTDATRFQRVVDLMHDVGELKADQKIDMHTMIIAQPAK
jgi:NitT/TauT family transport system substrate-binding protein